MPAIRGMEFLCISPFLLDKRMSLDVLGILHGEKSKKKNS